LDWSTEVRKLRVHSEPRCEVKKSHGEATLIGKPGVYVGDSAHRLRDDRDPVSVHARDGEYSAECEKAREARAGLGELVDFGRFDIRAIAAGMRKAAVRRARSRRSSRPVVSFGSVTPASTPQSISPTGRQVLRPRMLVRHWPFLRGSFSVKSGINLIGFFLLHRARRCRAALLGSAGCRLCVVEPVLSGNLFAHTETRRFSRDGPVADDRIVIPVIRPE
jgi:hypothetical protein